jgi:AraC-like DNA-binding protein
LSQYGFEIIIDKDLILVNQIKQAVIELIHYMNNMNSVVRKSEYLVEKLGKSYSHLSRIFSKYEPLTLEKYIILQKIERIKNLILQNEYSLSEISYMMDYSSVQYLSNQFKKLTGYSVTEFKNNPQKKINFIDKVSLLTD